MAACHKYAKHIMYEIERWGHIGGLLPENIYAPFCNIKENILQEPVIDHF